jgi:hypothetical protein
MAQKKVLNQANIDTANAKNAAAKEASANAAARAAALAPSVPTATNFINKSARMIALANRIGIKTESTKNIQPIIDRLTGISNQSTTDVIDPYNQAVQETETLGAQVEVPEAIYENEILNKSSTSAYDMIAFQLNNLGLSSLIGPLRSIFESGIDDADSLRLALSQTPEYQTRFSANAKRIGAGLSALNPAEYIKLEDQYQNVMRNYGLPASYYAKDATGKQIGFDAFLEGDVSASELEERLISAQDRVLKSNPEVLAALKNFYPGIANGDILAYSLDPKNALKDIQRKISAAEIGGAALAQGLTAGMSTAEELAGYGVTKAQAQQGFQNVALLAPRGGMLSEIYNEAPYNQETATAEVFDTAGAVEATRKRKRLTALEEASFGGQSGLAQNALARNSGAGSF